MTENEQKVLVDAMLSEIGTAQKYNSLVFELQGEIAQLQEAIRRLADQDATLSVQGGDVIVTMDATLTAEEREAIELFASLNWTSIRWSAVEKHADTLRKLLERLTGPTSGT